MPTPEKILEQMDAILDQMIQTAETLQKLSLQVSSDDELAPLQRSQENLVAQLASLDLSFQKAMQQAGNKKTSPLRPKIVEKLKQFQALNEGFIENLRTGQKLVEVEAPSSKKKKPR